MRRGFGTRSEVLARHGMAATSHPLATGVALDILKRGGSAVDAAIAANVTLGLVEPTGCGIGGDLFAIVWDAGSRELRGLNGSGRSPGDLTLEHLRGLGLSRIPPVGPLAVSVPGAVDGWYTLHEKFGALPVAELFEPAIGYAREGFPVTEVIAEQWEANAQALADQPGFAETFLRYGRPPAKGDVFQNVPLAETLAAIARGGRDAFYTGELAARISACVRDAGGFLSPADLEQHRSEWVAPVSTSYRGYDVWELPPNGQGIAALQMLNVLETEDVAAMGFGSADYLHLLIEAKKLAFEDRARFYADPDFDDIPVEALISKDYARKRRALIDPKHSGLTYEPGDTRLNVGDTVYLTTADDAGNLVSLIQSNFRGMGSGLCPKGLGFGLQDRGELFTLEDGHPNVYAPGKRPFHTIIPAFVTRDGDPVQSFGVMGGDVQPQMHVQVLVNAIDFGMNLQEAGDAPRLRHEGSSDPTGGKMSNGGEVVVEPGFPAASLAELERRGHLVREAHDGFGGYQAIRVQAPERVYIGASESRKDGHAAGY